jgi:ketosteroid isomerase-like protein
VQAAETQRLTSPIARQVALVERLFEAFARRDVDAVLELMDPCVRFMPVTAHMARGGKAYEGHDGIRQYLADASALWLELELLPRDFQAVLGVVVVIGEVRARGPAGEIRTPTVWTWKLHGDLIVEGTVHADLDPPRQALGYPSTDAE